MSACAAFYRVAGACRVAFRCIGPGSPPGLLRGIGAIPSGAIGAACSPRLGPSTRCPGSSDMQSRFILIGPTHSPRLGPFLVGPFPKGIALPLLAPMLARKQSRPARFCAPPRLRPGGAEGCALCVALHRVHALAGRLTQFRGFQGFRETSSQAGVTVHGLGSGSSRTC
jgi:hypothetical protein